VETPLSSLVKPGDSLEAAVASFEFEEIEDLRGECHSFSPFRWQEEDPNPTCPDDLVSTPPAPQDPLLAAERKAQQLEEEAYQKGYAQGQKDGFEFGRKSMSLVKEHLERLLGELQHLPSKILQDYREWLIQACLSISRQVIGRELKGDVNHLIELVDHVLTATDTRHPLTIHVHPDDLQLLREHVAFDTSGERSGRTFMVAADHHLQRGGCRMDSAVQSLDATIEKQLDLIEKALRNHDPGPATDID
jgi:flagellar assembly protein FliH